MNVPFDLHGYHDISLIGVKKDVLLASVTTTASPTPEPGTLSLPGTGLMGLVGIAKRRMAAGS